MLPFVVFCNLLLTLGNCYLIFRLCKFHNFLLQLTRNLTKLELCLHRVFAQAPDLIIAKQQETSQLRQKYKKLRRQIRQVKKILRLLKLGWRIWQGQRIKNY
ncbi:MAG TPA: hypothetical protein DCF68_08590 [Cyanothece sp. UBA12306]|nr:hypothetical protein [Cyanothece sp. UBA12306]